MEFSVSSLSYVGPKMPWMKRLDKEIGIEIFWDWGNEDFFKYIVPGLMEGRSGKFSIHGPMTHVAFTDDVPAERVFDELRKPFDLYHRCDSRFYVLHTHSNGCITPGMSDDELRKKRELAVERMYAFHEICKAEGVQLVIENIMKNPSGRTVFTEAEFLAIFQKNADLKCLLDTGHAILADYDIETVQRTLGQQLIAYHLHDNLGKKDDHLRIREGVTDWQQWKKNCCHYTPDAEIVLEYNDLTDENGYLEDICWIRSNAE